jgi:hypothetical protein
MPRQQIVFSANTMDFWRNSISGLASNINYGLANTFNTTGNIILTGSGLVLNVVNGSFKGNGSLIFGLNALAMFGTANNSKLQNTTLNVMTTAGISGGANGIALGSSITLTVSVNNSITNTRTDIPTAANTIPWALSKANGDTSNATLITVIVDETRGGTGESTYSPGEILIGNSLTGKFDKNTIASGAGVSILTSNGSINVSLNLIQGDGILLTSSGNGGITISANGIPAGNDTYSGLIQLYDAPDSLSTTLAVTANAVNAVHLKILETPGLANIQGRLIDRRVYTTANYTTSAAATGVNDGTRYVWTKPNNASFIAVMVLGGGAAGNRDTGDYLPSCGGAAGPTYAVYNAAAFAATCELFVGAPGSGVDGDYKGANSWFVNPAVLRSMGGERDSFGYSYSGTPANTWAQIHGGGGGVTGVVAYTPVWDKEFNCINSSGGLSMFMMNLANNGIAWAFGGTGASSPYGRGGAGGVIYRSTEKCDGFDATGYGAGGGGAVKGQSAGSEPRNGNGSSGLIIVDTYSNT